MQVPFNFSILSNAIYYMYCMIIGNVHWYKSPVIIVKNISFANDKCMIFFLDYSTVTHFALFFEDF